MVQFDGTPGTLSFDLKGNSATSGTAPASFLVEESSDAETWSQLDNLDETKISSSEYTSFSYALAGESRYVRWTFANKYGFNFGLNNVAISSGGPAEFSVTFDKENWFKVALGEASSVTAIPKNGIEPYTFLWESDTQELNGGTTDTLQIPDTLGEGDYTVACLVTEDNGEGDAINALIGFTVEAIPVITGDTYTKVTSLDDLTAGEYVITGASTDGKEEFAMLNTIGGSGAKTYINRKETAETIEDGSIVVSDASIVWTLAQDGSAWTISQEGFGFVYYSGSENSAGAEAEASDKSKWTISAGEDGLFAVVNVATEGRNLRYNSGSPRFACYAPSSSGSLTGKALAFYKKAGEAGLSVTLDKANGFTVDLGTPDSITATAKNGTEPYSYVWTSDTPDLNGTGTTLAIPATLAEGDYTVQIEVTDADSNKVSKQIGFSVVAPLEPHAINIAVGIQNGTVTSDPEGEAVKGTQVKLTATATTEGYALQEMTVTYGETVLTFTTSPATFEMPDEAVSVGATFAEVKDYAELPFVAEDTPYSGPWKTATQSGMTSKGLGNDYTSGGAVGARLDDTGDWLQIKFQGTAGELSYGIKGNSLSEEKPSTFKVQESADGETWADLATFTTGDNLTGSTVGYTNEVSASSQFVRFFYEEKGAGNVGIYDVYISSGGPAVFSIKLDPASYFEVEVGEEASIAATPKNAEGEVHYEWTVGGVSAGGDSAVLGLDTRAATEVLEVVCNAQDAANTIATAKVSYKVVAPAPKYKIECAIGIPNGSVSADKTEAEEGELVTLTAKPDAGYKLEHFLLDGVAFTENPFPMPAKDILVSASFVEATGETFTLVESAEDFEEGADYLIVAYSKDKFTSALKNEPSDKRIAVDEVVISEEKTVVTDSDAIVWTISAGAEGKYTLYNAAKGVYAAAPTGASANEARLLEDGTDETAQWTIAIAEDALVTIGSLHEGKALQRNSTAANAYFANYKSGTKPFLFKKSGPASPKITFTGDTTVELGGSFALQFELKNYDGAFTWEVASREGGSINADGLYTWEPTAAGDVNIKVIAVNGGLEIASKEVALTVTEPGPIPGEPALVFGGDKGGTVGTPVNFTVASVNVFSDPAVYPEGFEAPEGSSLTEEGIAYDMPNVSFMPDVPGDYVFNFSSGEVGASDYVEGSWTVTVSEGPGPQPSEGKITKLTIANNKMTIEFEGEGAQVILSDDMQAWTPVDGAISPFTFDMKEAAKKYIGVK